MTTLQELITRGRFVMADAPSRLEVFEAVDGRRTAPAIARLTSRHVNNVRRDLNVLRDAGLIEHDGARNPVYAKVPLARTIPVRYFQSTGDRPQTARIAETGGRVRVPRRGAAGVAVPNESELLAIARDGEDQVHEFKAPGVDATKLAKEVAAMLNTSRGGLILYGVDDDGAILGSDFTRQQMDQRVQNAVKNSIAPSAVVTLHSVSALGSDVVVIRIPPWNRKDVYQYQEKVYIRKGTNAFGASPEEMKSLHRGVAVV